MKTIYTKQTNGRTDKYKCRVKVKQRIAKIKAIDNELIYKTSPMILQSVPKLLVKKFKHYKFKTNHLKFNESF